MTLEKTGEWHLASGTWQVQDLADRTHGPQLLRTRLGHVIAPEVHRADIARLMQARAANNSDSAALYPPEFEYSPANGARLAPAGAPAAPWVPPAGAHPVGQVTQGHVVGLRQTSVQLHLQDKAGFNAESDPAARMTLPPSGDYQFLSARFGTQANGLLAIDPEKGSLFAWLPASARWAPLHGVAVGGGSAGAAGFSGAVGAAGVSGAAGAAGFSGAAGLSNAGDTTGVGAANGAANAAGVADAADAASAAKIFLAESNLPYAAWRAELHLDFNSRVFIATDAGLACVTPDLLALQYDVRYAGDGPAVGAPLAFQGLVWAPVQTAPGQLSLVALNADGQPGPQVRLTEAPPLFGVGAPVGYGRTAIWPCMTGQLVLQRQSDGGFAAQFIPWPAGLAPQFAFGSPYLAKDGDLWQLCFDSHRHRYAYVALGKILPEIEPALGPRLSSGAMNYRFATKHYQAPWIEPEHGDDGATKAVVIPLLEVGPGSTVGIKLASTVAVAQTLASTERLRFQLVWDDRDGETTFNTSVLPQPWTLRLFTHDGKLWAYHPELKDILGWNLTA